PDRLATDRLPCFATWTPPAAATRAAAVEMLNVPRPSPPVPQVSTTPARPWRMWTERRRMAAAAPAISGTDSPFIRSATRSAALIGSLTRPSMSCPNRSSVSSRVRCSPAARRQSASFAPFASATGHRLLRCRRLQTMLPAHLEEVGEQVAAGAGQHRLGMELHAPIREQGVMHAHEDAVVRGPGHGPQLRRQGLLLHVQAVIAGRLERIGKPGEHAHVL